MQKFDYLASTKIYFGKDREKEVGEIISSYGIKKVLLHYGGGSIKKNGLYSRVMDSLNASKIEVVELGGVLPNPDVELVKKGIEICRKNQIELILAVGGGSVLDSSKLIAHGVYYDGDPYDISLKKHVSTKALPVGSILTISAAGSEMSTSCVISSRELKRKKGFNSELNRPLFAIENPELTYSVDAYQTGCGVTDIIAHTLERYFNHSDDLEFSDYLAEGLIKSVIDASKVVKDNPQDYNARATLMLASSYSHNGLTNLGKNGVMPIHQLEHELSALYPNVAHGAGLAVLIPAWMKVCYHLDEAKFIKFSKNVMGEEDVNVAIEKLQNVFLNVSMPSRLSEFGVTKQDLITMADALTSKGNIVIPSNIPLTRELALKVYEECL